MSRELVSQRGVARLQVRLSVAGLCVSGGPLKLGVLTSTVVSREGSLFVYVDLVPSL